jgi:hypothetical protein
LPHSNRRSARSDRSLSVRASQYECFQVLQQSHKIQSPLGARGGLGAAAAAVENWADSSPFHHHNDCCALARLHAGFRVAVSMEKAPGTCFAGGGANGLELRRSLWLEAGSVRQRRRAKTGPTEAPCTTVTTAVLLPGCMHVAISMEKPPGTCFAGGGANGPELRRSLWLEAGSVRQRR